MKKVVATVSLAVLLTAGGCGGMSGVISGNTPGEPTGKHIEPIPEKETKKSLGSKESLAKPYPPKIEPGIQGEFSFKVNYRGLSSSDIDKATLEQRKKELGDVLFSSWRGAKGFINAVEGVNVDSRKTQNLRIQSEYDQIKLDYDYFKQLFKKELTSNSDLQEINTLYKKTLATMEGECGDEWKQVLVNCKKEFARLKGVY